LGKPNETGHGNKDKTMALKTHRQFVRWTFLILLNCFFFFSKDSSAQEEKKYVRDGNKAYDKGKYKEAEDQYQKALGLNPGNYTGAFNLGDAFYKQGKSKEAAAKFEELTKSTTGDDKLNAKAYHNLGNALLRDKKYEDALTAYKKALTLNPKDEDTRYNLGYTQQMLKQQEQKKNKDKKDDKKDNKKDDKKDKQDKEKDQGKKDPDKKDKQNDKDKQKPNPSKPDENQQNRVSKDAAQKMLNEVNNNERKVQNKLKKQKESAVSAKIEKDW
jgi:Ca-activated chloride channel family protein